MDKKMIQRRSERLRGLESEVGEVENDDDDDKESEKGEEEEVERKEIRGDGRRR